MLSHDTKYNYVWNDPITKEKLVYRDSEVSHLKHMLIYVTSTDVSFE